MASLAGPIAMHSAPAGFPTPSAPPADYNAAGAAASAAAAAAAPAYASSSSSAAPAAAAAPAYASSSSSAAPAAAPAPAAGPTKAEIRAGIVELASKHILDSLDRIFTKEGTDMQTACTQAGKPTPKDAIAHTYAVINGVERAIVLRDAQIIKACTIPNLDTAISALAASQKSCFNAILNKCVDKIEGVEKYLTLGIYIGFCEPHILLQNKQLHFENSKILRSKVLSVSLTVKGDKLAAFAE